MKIYVFYPCCQVESLDVYGRMATGQGIHCVAADDMRDAKRIIEEELPDKRDFMIIAGTELKRWVDKSFPWDKKE